MKITITQVAKLLTIRYGNGPKGYTPFHFTKLCRLFIFNGYDVSKTVKAEEANTAPIKYNTLEEWQRTGNFHPPLNEA